MLLRRLRIASRSVLGFALMALLVVIVGSFSLLQMKRMNAQAQEVDSNWLPSILGVSEISQDILRIRAGTLRLIVVRDPAIMQQTTQRLVQLKSKLMQAQSGYERLISSPEERELYGRFKVAEQAYMVEQEKIMRFSEQDMIDEAIEVASGDTRRVRIVVV